MHPYFRKVNPDCTCFRVLFIYLDNENVFDAIFGIFLKSANKERTPIYCNTHKKLCTIDDRNLKHIPYGNYRFSYCVWTWHDKKFTMGPNPFWRPIQRFLWFYEIFSKYKRIQKHPVMVKKFIVRLHISFGPIVLHI